MSEVASSKTPRSLTLILSHTLSSTRFPFFFLTVALTQSHIAVRDSEWGRLHRETPVREKGAVYSTCTFNEQFLPMTTQQRPGQEGGKVHKYLPQQWGHLLQGALQFCCDATVGRRKKKIAREKLRDLD